MFWKVSLSEVFLEKRWKLGKCLYKHENMILADVVVVGFIPVCFSLCKSKLSCKEIWRESTVSQQGALILWEMNISCLSSAISLSVIETIKKVQEVPCSWGPVHRTSSFLLKLCVLLSKFHNIFLWKNCFSSAGLAVSVLSKKKPKKNKKQS